MAVRRDIEYLIKVYGADKVQKEIDRVKGSVKGTGEAAAAAGVQAKGFGGAMSGALASAGKALTSFLAGFVGITAVISLFRGLLSHIKQVRDMLQSLAEQAVAAQIPMQKLAMQEGITLKEATKRAAGTALATGATMDIAAESRRAVHSAMGAGAVTGGVADVLAGTMARTGGDVEQTGQLAELMQRFEVKTAADAKNLIAKLEAGMSQTTYGTVGEIASAVGKGGLQGIIEGATPEDMIALMAQARGATSTKEESAELLKQISQTFMKPELRTVAERQSGKGFWDMTYAERFAAAGTALESMTREEQETVLGKLMPREKQRAMNFFGSKSAAESRERARTAMQGATAGTVDRLQSEYLQTGPAQQRMIEAGKQREVSGLSPYQTLQGLMRKEATGRLDRLRAQGQIGFLDDKLSWNESQIESAMYEQQLQTLGITPRVMAGTQNANQLLGAQLIGAIKSRGISLPGGGESRMGFAKPNRTGMVDPRGEWVPASSGVTINAENIVFPRSDLRTTTQGVNIGGGVK